MFVGCLFCLCLFLVDFVGGGLFVVCLLLVARLFLLVL